MRSDGMPLFHLARRSEEKPLRAWTIRLMSFVAAILIGGLIFLLLGDDPIMAYGNILGGSLGRATGQRQTVKFAVPLLGTALAIAPCFKMKFWNIGAEGQITAGAIGAAWLAISFGKVWPRPVMLISMGMIGMVFGALWALLPAVFKARWGTNETLFTLMMNYIAIGLVKWLQGGPWEGRPGSQIIPDFAPAAQLPDVLGVHCGWIIVVALVFFMYIYMNYTKHGYEISVLGESRNTARYAGMNVGWITIRTMLLSGAICGLVGFMVASGAHYTLYHTVADGVGFTAITVAWLAQLNPFAMIVISLLLAVLDKGAGTLQTAMKVPASISDVITGIFLFCMLASEFFINYRIIINHSHGKEAARG